MAQRPDYADNLRDALLALALVPVAGLKTASYWLTESLTRASTFSAEVVSTVTLARTTLRPGASAADRTTDPAADVLADDLLDAARAYVRSMVRLPADSGIYFTAELESLLRVLLERLQPDATEDPGTFVAGELETLVQALNRLSVFASVQRERGRRSGRRPDVQATLVAGLQDLRDRTKAMQRRALPPRPAARRRATPASRGDARLRGLDVEKARSRLTLALQDAEALLPRDAPALAKFRNAIDTLGRDHNEPRRDLTGGRRIGRWPSARS